MRSIFLFLVGLSANAVALDMSFAETKTISFSSASDFGVSIERKDSIGFSRYIISVADIFPCKLKGIGVSTFNAAGSPILSVYVQETEQPFHVDVGQEFISGSRVDFDCEVKSKYETPTYIMELENDS